MTDHEQPQHGGSFIRQKDGSLKPAGAAPQPSEPAPVAPASGKPAKTKAEK